MHSTDITNKSIRVKALVVKHQHDYNRVDVSRIQRDCMKTLETELYGGGSCEFD